MILQEVVVEALLGTCILHDADLRADIHSRIVRGSVCGLLEEAGLQQMDLPAKNKAALSPRLQALQESSPRFKARLKLHAILQSQVAITELAKPEFWRTNLGNGYAAIRDEADFYQHAAVASQETPRSSQNGAFKFEKRSSFGALLMPGFRKHQKATRKPKQLTAARWLLLQYSDAQGEALNDASWRWLSQVFPFESNAKLEAATTTKGLFLILHRWITPWWESQNATNESGFGPESLSKCWDIQKTWNHFRQPMSRFHFPKTLLQNIDSNRQEFWNQPEFLENPVIEVEAATPAAALRALADRINGSSRLKDHILESDEGGTGG